jgi:regulator of cell morphogenesis and NO signaling
MENLETLTLGEIVRNNYHAAAVLEKFSLDFCCKGNRKIEEACNILLLLSMN